MIKQATTLIVALFIISCSTQERVSENREKVFIDSLMNVMTLEEKIGQLNLPTSGDITTGQASSSDIGQKIIKGEVGGLFNIKTASKIREVQRIAVEDSRLKIPLIFGMDVIHGYKTVFPVPLALSCTWDMELIEKSAQIAAKEASADGICWTFSPMVDIARDPRWGRITEGAGEDPYLGSAIAKAMVEGYQGDDLTANNTIMACVKHFALYGAAEAGRDYNTVDMSRLRMYNEYLPPYKAAVDAGVGSVMTSFNTVDGIPASGNKWLLTDLLRNEWGFDGFVVTDYTAINEMIAHGLGDLQKVSELAIGAGTDMDMVGEGFLKTLMKSLDEGKITEQDIDNACRRILEAKYRLGLFEDPYKYCDLKRDKTDIYTDEHLAIARKIASESFVLLKNDNHTLPLKKKGTIALIGPLADNAENMAGSWSVAGDFEKNISLKQGLENVAGSNVTILYARGANITSDPGLEARVSIFGKPTRRDDRPESVMIQEAIATAKKADVIVAAMGEPSEMSGESSSLSNIELPENQRTLLKELLKTGKPVVLVLFTGRPLAIKWESENIPSILNVWFGGSQTGNAIADVLFGDVNPSGKLTTTFPQNTGQIPLYYNHLNTGRPLEGEWFEKFKSNYLDVSNVPVYPFGYGLSYSTFEYSNLFLNKSQVTKSDSIDVQITLTNTGKVAGSEVTQLYIRDLAASISRPVKELKGFTKTYLEPGQSKTLHFTLHNDELSFYNSNLKWVSEPGEFNVYVGGSSQDNLSANFELID